jgi:hypothetical protein
LKNWQCRVLIKKEEEEIYNFYIPHRKKKGKNHKAVIIPRRGRDDIYTHTLDVTSKSFFFFFFKGRVKKIFVEYYDFVRDSRKTPNFFVFF